MAHDGSKQIAPWKRGKFKGRSGNGPNFVMLRHDVLGSDPWKSLSGNAVKLAIFIANQYNGKNNGDLSMGWKDLHRAGWKSEETATKARDQLLRAGFLLITRHAVGRQCHLFALTWFPIDDCPGKHLEVAPTRTPLDLWKTNRAPQKLGDSTPEIGGQTVKETA